MYSIEKTRGPTNAGLRIASWCLAAAISTTSQAQTLSTLPALSLSIGEGTSSTPPGALVELSTTTLHVYPGSRDVTARLELEILGGLGEQLLLNVMSDADHDGALSDDEWVVRNQVVTTNDDVAATVLSLPFVLSHDPAQLHSQLLTIRFALGIAPATSPDDVDATGDAGAQLEFLWPSAFGAPLPLLALDCPSRIVVKPFSASDFQCEVVAHTPSLSTLSYELSSAAGNVEVNGMSEVSGQAMAPGVMSFTATASGHSPSRWHYSAQVREGSFPAQRSELVDRFDFFDLPLTINVHPSAGDITFVVGTGDDDAVTTDAMLVESSGALSDKLAFSATSSVLEATTTEVSTGIEVESTTTTQLTATETRSTTTVALDTEVTTVEETLDDAIGLCGCVEPELFFDEMVIGHGFAGIGGDAISLEGALIFEGMPSSGETFAVTTMSAMALPESTGAASETVSLFLAGTVPVLSPTLRPSGDSAPLSDEERQQAIQEALEQNGVKRFMYWTVTNKEGVIYFVRDPKDPKNFKRIIDPTKMIFVTVDGVRYETDVIDISDAANNLAPLTPKEEKLAARIVGNIPPAWDEHLALTPGDIVLVSLLYEFLGESELGERITKMRADGKSAKEIFLDSEVRNAMLLSLAMNAIPGGGKCKQVVKRSKSSIKQAVKRTFFYFFNKEKYKGMMLVEWMTNAFNHIKMSNFGFSSKKYAKTVVDFIQEHYGEVVALKDVRKITDKAVMKQLEKKGALKCLPNASVLDERGNLTQEFIDFVLDPIERIHKGLSREEIAKLIQKAELKVFNVEVRNELPSKLLDILNLQLKKTF